MFTTFIVFLFLHPSSATASRLSSTLELAFGGGFGEGGGDDDGRGKNPISEWSSTIGIATAIVGNLLISVALNTQRYAHVRINRELERNRQRRKWERASPRLDRSEDENSHSYGTLHRPSGVDRAERTPSNGFRHGLQESDSQGQAHQPRQSEDVAGDRLHHSSFSERTISSLEKSAASLDRQSYLHSPYWWCGLVLMMIGEAGNFLAYGFAPASIVSPLGVVALVSNCIIAPFMLKEKFRQRDFWGVVVAIAGAVIVVLSAKTSEVKIGPGDIWGMITRWEFETYMGITLTFMVILMWVSERYGRKSILIDLGLVALFGGYTALSTKGVASLLSYRLWHVITFPITYGLVAVLVISAMMQIRYLNRSLQRFDSTQVIPTQFVLFTISVILGSAILYRDFESATLARSLKFVGGCALTFLGVYLITSGRPTPTADDEQSDDEEETIGLLGGNPYRDHVDELDGDHSNGRHSSDTVVPISDNKPSSARSLPFSDEVDLGSEEENGDSTPRARLAGSPTSALYSVSDTSSILRSFDASPQDIDTNPFLTPNHESSNPNSAILHSPSQPEMRPPQTPVLLQFPSAPGLTEFPPRHELQTPQHSPRRPTTPRTDPHRLTSRPPLSLRFSPGPFLPPLSGGLSGGLSAVVADSLRRGEGFSRRRSLHGGTRQQFTNRLLETAAPADRDAPAVHRPDITENCGEEEQDQFDFSRQHERDLTALEPDSGIQRTTSTVTPQITNNEPQRLRSLSDSWNGGIFRLGGSVRLSSRRLRDRLNFGSSNVSQSDSRTPPPTAENSGRPE
ncbi:hypothetical protein FQN57_002439 [Myotisia sp. PD_48]|nr:hypothetical protein FQN57_002439 [Myotisia sp. PD_48]